MRRLPLLRGFVNAKCISRFDYSTMPFSISFMKRTTDLLGYQWYAAKLYTVKTSRITGASDNDISYVSLLLAVRLVQAITERLLQMATQAILLPSLLANFSVIQKRILRPLYSLNPQFMRCQNCHVSTCRTMSQILAPCPCMLPQFIL